MYYVLITHYFLLAEYCHSVCAVDQNMFRFGPFFCGSVTGKVVVQREISKPFLDTCIYQIPYAIKQ